MTVKQHKAKTRIKVKWQEGSLFLCSPKRELATTTSYRKQVSMQEKPPNN